MKKTMVLAALIVMIFSVNCLAKDLGTITLKHQPKASPVTSPSPILSPVFPKSNQTSVNGLDERLVDLVRGWMGMAQKISDKAGIEWNKKLGIILFHSRSKITGIKVGEKDVKLSISKSNGTMIVTGFRPDQGLYASYEKSF